MKIAICDDEAEDRELFCRYCKKCDPSITPGLFENGQQLLDAFQKEFYDIVFLDIEMDPLDGLVVGKRLMQQERKPVIVFVTHSPAYAPRGYGIAIRYLCKPISFEKFRSTLYVAQEKAQLDRMLVHCEGEQVVLRLQDIQYVEVLSHCLLFHLGNGQVITERNSLSAIMSQLPAWQFVQSHKSYCVNLDYVQRANVNTVTLTDGTEIPLSRGNITHFRDCLSQFVNRKNAMG